MPEKIKKINTSALAFKLMENIELFTRAAKEYGLSDAEAFQTVDLWDGEVIINLDHGILLISCQAI
jgi:hypothetical protein